MFIHAGKLKTATFVSYYLYKIPNFPISQLAVEWMRSLRVSNYTELKLKLFNSIDLNECLV